MAKNSLRLSLIAAATAVISAGAALAQVSDSNVRAVNLARNWAVNTTGGLSVYVPAACMFNTGDGGGSCLIQNTNKGFTFRFLGGTPGWQVEGRPASTETELQVSPDCRTVTNVLYNGTPR